ncbi:MAG: hypothetical protein ACI4ME_10975 [Aristaeellaceae bacterium]
MKLDPNKVYGEVPSSFTHRVEYALRRCVKEETKPMKRKSIVAILLVVLALALTTTAVAAVLSGTIPFFGQQYGSDFQEKLEQGTVAPGGQSTVVNGVTVTMTDFVVVPEKTEWLFGEGELDTPVETLSFYATGTLVPAPGENLVLLADLYEYAVTDPAGYDLFYGTTPEAPEGAPSYADVARERGATLRQVRCIANGILDEEGHLLVNTIGSCIVPQVDGSVVFSIEIPSEHIIPQQDSYQMSLSIDMEDLDAEGNPIEGTYMQQDWIVTLVPRKAE